MYARIQKVLSEVVQLWQRFIVFCLFLEGREDRDTTKFARQRNAI